MPVIGFIGTGNMGGALAKAAAANTGNTVLLANRSRAKADALAEITGGCVCTNEEVIAKSDYAFLGVKPNMLSGVLGGLEDAVTSAAPSTVLVSMAAGVSIASITGMLKRDLPVIRIMPNTPVAVGAGLILYACSPLVTSELEEGLLEAMKNAGKFSKIDEKLIDAGSAVSGCGPAFAALFIEALADGGVACGLPRAKALEFAAQTAMGTAKLILDAGKHPGVLKDEVCSPGGTTIQGVRALEAGGFRSAAIEAVIAAYEKTVGA